MLKYLYSLPILAAFTPLWFAIQAEKDMNRVVTVTYKYPWVERFDYFAPFCTEYGNEMQFIVGMILLYLMYLVIGEIMEAKFRKEVKKHQHR